MWDALRIDARHSLRALRRSPGFTIVVILTVALAIGATATISSLLNAIVLRAVSTTDPGRLVSIFSHQPQQEQLATPWGVAPPRWST